MSTTLASLRSRLAEIDSLNEYMDESTRRALLAALDLCDAFLEFERTPVRSTSFGPSSKQLDQRRTAFERALSDIPEGK